MPPLHPPVSTVASHTTLIAWWIALNGLQTRSDLMRASGLGRSQVGAAWEALQRKGLLAVAGTERREHRGQPASLGHMSPRAGVVLAVDCGASIARVALCTMGRKVLLRESFEVDLAVGPQAFLELLAGLIDPPVAAAINSHGPLRHIVIGIPARIDYSKSAPVRPTIMPGWDGARIGRLLEEQYGCDVIDRRLLVT